MSSPQVPQQNSPLPAHEPSADAVSGDRELWRNANLSERELQRMHSGVPIQCQFCVGQTFRRSRLRAADLGTLLLMRYPVRCLRCAQRQTVSFTVAGISMPSYLRRRDAPNPQSSPDSSSRPGSRPGKGSRR